MVIIGLMFIGAVMGWGCAALFHQRQGEALDQLRQQARQDKALIAAQDQHLAFCKTTIAQQAGMIDRLNATEGPRNRLEDVSK